MEEKFEVKLRTILSGLADLALKHYDPCKIEGSRCLAGDPNPCCTKGIPHPEIRREDGLPGCKYTGGNIEKQWCRNPNLACKVWLCQTAIAKTDMECFSILCAVEAIAKQFGWMRPPYLGEEYTGADRD